MEITFQKENRNLDIIIIKTIYASAGMRYNKAVLKEKRPLYRA